MSNQNGASMQLIGLTGGIATGKTTASAFLQQKGITVISADELAKQALTPGSSGHAEACKIFPDVVDKRTGVLDRSKLGDIVFRDVTARKQLERIVHPAVRFAMAKAIFWNWLQGHDRIVLDIPLLFETHLDRWMSYTVVISASPILQKSRLRDRNGFDPNQAESRISSQLPTETKCLLADVVIDNEQDLESLHDQLQKKIVVDQRPNWFVHKLLLHVVPIITLGIAFMVMLAYLFVAIIN